MSSIKEALERTSRALKELQAFVWGECPSLLDEDRGGNARLDIDIDEALELAEAALATFQPDSEKREAIAFKIYSHSNNPKLWDQPNSVLARDNAYSIADLLLASGLMQENKK